MNSEEDLDELNIPEDSWVDSNEFFCRFTPHQLDRFASALLGEEPICEKWISKDGKTAILNGLNFDISKIARAQCGEPVHKRLTNIAEVWNQKFNHG